MYSYVLVLNAYFCLPDIGPILDDRLKEKILKPWKGALSIHFRVCLSVSVCVCVCVCLCTRATDHSFWARNLFG